MCKLDWELCWRVVNEESRIKTSVDTGMRGSKSFHLVLLLGGV